MISKISVIVELFKAIENYIHCGKILFKKFFFYSLACSSIGCPRDTQLVSFDLNIEVYYMYIYVFNVRLKIIPL